VAAIAACHSKYEGEEVRRYFRPLRNYFISADSQSAIAFILEENALSIVGQSSTVTENGSYRAD